MNGYSFGGLRARASQRQSLETLQWLTQCMRPEFTNVFSLFSQDEDLPEDAKLQARFFPLISAQLVRPEEAKLRALVGDRSVVAIGPWRGGHLESTIREETLEL